LNTSSANRALLLSMGSKLPNREQFEAMRQGYANERYQEINKFVETNVIGAMQAAAKADQSEWNVTMPDGWDDVMTELLKKELSKAGIVVAFIGSEPREPSWFRMRFA
jgi:hypothetical protein